MAEEIALLPPMAVANAKRALYQGADTNLQAAYEIENMNWTEVMQSDDAKLALQTFLAVDPACASRLVRVRELEELPRLLRTAEASLCRSLPSIRIDQLGEIVIDNPPQNLFSGDVLTDLGVAIKDAATSNVRAVLVRAEGDDFSAGADASVFSGYRRGRKLRSWSHGLSLHPRRSKACRSQPVALIQGQCYAGALEICIACDLIWAAEGSQIGQIEAVAGGIPYGAGPSASLRGSARPAPRRWCSRPPSCRRRRSCPGASSTGCFQPTASARRAGLSGNA